MPNSRQDQNKATLAKEEHSTSLPCDEFAAILEESFVTQSPAEGSVIKGKVVAIENDFAVIDVGLKTEGRVPLTEFAMPGIATMVNVGDEVEVYLERAENALGEAVLSRDKARREESWGRLEKAFNDQARVQGVIFGRVKGGFTVDLDGAVAFLPGSQVDVLPVRDVGPLMNQPQMFQILKMDRRRGNIVVSRRAVLEERRAEERFPLIASLQEKQVVEGVVKSITDYGAFVDLGGVDGLLHVTDITWRRVSHPTEVLSVGQTVTVQIIKINHETQRISLGMKQLQTDPWEGVAAKYPPGVRFNGKVTNVTDYGAFVELEPGVEGLVHVSEMSWVKKNVAPSKIVVPGTEVDVQVLEVDSNKRRISLGLKQTQDNPWQVFAAEHPAGTVVEGEIKSITEFGLFVGVADEIDGMVHLSDLSWDKAGDQAVAEYQKGQKVKAKVLDVDVEKERISLGIKQLEADPREPVGKIRVMKGILPDVDVAGKSLKAQTGEDGALLDVTVENKIDTLILVANTIVDDYRSTHNVEKAAEYFLNESEPQRERQVVAVALVAECSANFDYEDFVEFIDMLLDTCRPHPNFRPVSSLLLAEVGDYFRSLGHSDTAASYLLAAARDAIVSSQARAARDALARLSQLL